MRNIIASIFLCTICIGIYAKGSTTTDSVAKYNIGLNEVSVFGKYYIHSDAKNPQMGMTKLQGSLIKKIPALLGEPDIIKALHTQPGVSSGVEGFSGLYVRGGNGDENLMTLDGIQLYQVTHLGGLFSTFNADIVKDVTFYKSSFPASYGGRLSSVVDIDVKESCDTAFHGSVMIGLTSGNFSFGGPIIKNRTSFAFSIRRSWLDVISIPAIAIMNSIHKKDGTATIGQYAFTDINFRLDHKFSKNSRIALNCYWGNDFLKYGDKKFQMPGEDPFETKNINKLVWGNFLVSAHWIHNYSPILSHNIAIAYTDYKSSNETNISNIEGDKNDIDFYENTNINKLSKNGISDITFKADWNLRLPQLSLKYGANYIYHRYSPFNYRFQSHDNGNSIDSIYSDTRLSAHEMGIYADALWSPFKWGSITAGLRLAGFNIYNKMEWSLEPRVSTQIKFTDFASLKISYTRMRQFSQQVSNSYINLPTDFWMPIDDGKKASMCDQLSAGVYYDIQNKYSFSVEGYYKWIDNIADTKYDFNNIYSYEGLKNKLAYGKGRSYGIDMVAYKETGRLTGWISYSLLWAFRKTPEINDGLEYPAKFDNRHKINIVLNYKFKKNIEFNASWTYMTGNRITLSLNNYQASNWAGFPSTIAPGDNGNKNLGISYYSGKNNLRLPDYHRLDIGVTISQPKKNGNMGIWNFGLYNAYCQMNPIAIQQKNMQTIHPAEGDEWNTTFQTIALFPIIPSISYTYKF